MAGFRRYPEDAVGHHAKHLEIQGQEALPGQQIVIGVLLVIENLRWADSITDAIC
jgi:hypothetical protein